MRHLFLSAMACTLVVSGTLHADTAAAAGAQKHLVRLYKATLLINSTTQLPFLPRDLNNRAEVAGSNMVADEFFLYHAAKWQGGHVTLLPELPDTSSSDATGTNDHGDFVGSDVVRGPSRTGGPRGVLWQDGTVMDLGAPAGTHDFSPRAINNRREVIGTASDLNGYVWSAGTFARLAFAPDSRNPQPEDINNVGSVAGWEIVPASSMTPQATLWRAGGVELLGVLPGKDSSEAKALNDFDHVAGVSFGSGEQAFFWREGTMTALPPVLEGDETTALAINDWDQVVGTEISADGTSFPVLWENGRALRLDELIRPADKEQMDPDMPVHSAYGINEWGQILVDAYPLDPNSTSISFYLLTPVFEWQ